MVSPIDVIREMDNATSSFAAGLNALTSPGWSLLDHAGTFGNLAGGIERLTKLSIGMATFDDTGVWKHPHGHGIADLAARVDALLADRMGRAVHPAYIGTLHEHVHSDTVLALLLAALDAWAATSGRYGVLDKLGGREVKGPSPEELWNEAEQQAALAVRVDLAAPDGSGIRALREELAGALLRWWHLIYRAWAHGVFGSMGRQLSSELDPERPVQLNALSRRLLNGL